MGEMNWKRPTATQGTMNHAKTSFSTEISAGAIISVVQYLALLRYLKQTKQTNVQSMDSTGMASSSMDSTNLRTLTERALSYLNACRLPAGRFERSRCAVTTICSGPIPRSPRYVLTALKSSSSLATSSTVPTSASVGGAGAFGVGGGNALPCKI
jgi:hypothetical protein